MYTVKVLNDKEFEKLPFKYVKNAIGCADADAGVAYVRETGVKDIDMSTIEHEIEELVAVVSPHEEDGIRYKKWGKPFRALFGNEEQRAAQQGTVSGNVIGGGGGGGILGSLGSLALAPLTGGASLAYMAPMAAAGGALQGGLQGKGLKEALLGALKGYGTGNIVSGGAGLVKGATAGTGMLKGAMEGLTSYGINPAIGKALGMTGNVSPAASAGISKAATSIKPWMLPEVVGQPTIGSPISAASTLPASLTAGLISALPKTGFPVPAKPAVTPTAPAVPNITTPVAPAESVLGNIGKVAGPAASIASPLLTSALGAGLMGASAMPKQAEFEKVASLEQLRNEIATKGSSPALYMRARRALAENYEKANTELDTLYNQAGMLDSGEYRDQKAKLMAKKADAEELLAAQIDEQTMNDLLGLTNMDINIAALKYGADAEDIRILREILGSTGGVLLGKGAGLY